MCKGIVLKATVKQFHNRKGALFFKYEFRLHKKKSCSCSECRAIMDGLCHLALPKRIEHGKFYTTDGISLMEYHNA